jgi:hypothetical protein
MLWSADTARLIALAGEAVVGDDLLDAMGRWFKIGYEVDANGQQQQREDGESGNSDDGRHGSFKTSEAVAEQEPGCEWRLDKRGREMRQTRKFLLVSSGS